MSHGQIKECIYFSLPNIKCAPEEMYNRHSNIYDTTDYGKLENTNLTKNKSLYIKNCVCVCVCVWVWATYSCVCITLVGWSQRLMLLEANYP
jgi:hypothetical protein